MEPTPNEPPVINPQTTGSITKAKLTKLLAEISHDFRQQAKAQTAPRPIEVISHGPAPLLISAPHATPHVRQGQTKAVEPMTGALAIALAQSLGASAILPVGRQLDDPNFDTDEQAPYKQKLAGVLGRFQLLVDLHGMRDSWQTDICVGVADSNSEPKLTRIIDVWKRRASQISLTLTINQPFDSRMPGTVSTFARKHGCWALQVELSKASRQPEKIAETFLLIRQGLAEWLPEVDPPKTPLRPG